MAESNVKETQHLRLILDLELSPLEATPEALKREIMATVHDLMDAGILPDDSPATIEDWTANVVELENPAQWCTFCRLPYGPGAHSHQRGMVCENCWDERLRMTE